jgi:hypothetical protein
VDCYNAEIFLPKIVTPQTLFFEIITNMTYLHDSAVSLTPLSLTDTAESTIQTSKGSEFFLKTELIQIQRELYCQRSFESKQKIWRLPIEKKITNIWTTSKLYENSSGCETLAQGKMSDGSLAFETILLIMCGKISI